MGASSAQQELQSVLLALLGPTHHLWEQLFVASVKEESTTRGLAAAA